MSDHGQVYYASISSEEKARMARSDIAYRTKTDQEQTDTRLQTEYHIPLYTPVLAGRTDFEEKKDLESMRNVINHVFAYRQDSVFQGYDRIATNVQDTERVVPLHHAIGTQMLVNGEKVLEIDVGGSSFETFRREYTGFHGEGKDTGNQGHFEQVYGKKLGEFEQGGIFKKVKRTDDGLGTVEDNTRYTISGPMFWGGKMDQGDFKINHIREYIFGFGAMYFRDIFSNPAYQAHPVNVNLNIQGHSRGAVAVALAVHDLAEKMKQEFPLYGEKIKINMIQHDPVPGPAQTEKEKKKIDFRGIGNPINDAVNATTIYSLHTQYNAPIIFKPQRVRGQKRIILTSAEHSVGLEEGDKSQLDAQGDLKYHRKAIFDARTGEAYRGSGMSEMPPGVYVLDANGVAVKLRSLGHAMEIVKEYKGSHIAQDDRRYEILSAVKDWFVDNEYVDDAEVNSDAEYEEERNHAYEVMGELLNPEGFHEDSDLLRKVKDDVRAIEDAYEHNRIPTEAEYNSAITSCKTYLDERKIPLTPGGWKRMAKVGEVLSQLRAEKWRMQNGRGI